MTASSPPLRRQQAEALAEIRKTWGDGRHAAWVVLPPGGGKTRLGLEALQGFDDPAVILCPNTAVQSQWVAQATALGLQASDDKSLTSAVSVLTYQSVALFQEGEDPDTHFERLHPNALTLIDRLADLGPLTLILDECHHLLEVWGELLAEVLDRLPQARVLALTATPPQVLSEAEAALVTKLFGSIVYTASSPGFVKEGHLAPFRELVLFTEPTPAESDYLAATAERFAQLRTDLLTPGLSSTDFLTWLDRRFVFRELEDASGSAPAVEWKQLVRTSPDLADAALRAAHAGMLAVPAGARLREQHRVGLTVDDWALLLGDFVKGVLLDSQDPKDAALLESLRATLPGVGLRLGRKGLSRTTSPVDRVVARSRSKALAAVDIADREWAALGNALRLLVLCDFERASAQVPQGLDQVIAAEEGSALAVTRALAADPLTSGLHPVMVTGSVVACSGQTAASLLSWLQTQNPALTLTARQDDSLVYLEGNWTSKQWVPLLTAWFELGLGQVLVGTRALLGEGWDVQKINVLVDLTTATTSVAVTQTRGRALRTDRTDLNKVAHTWTVVCVADGHPLGQRDYQRFVRKHAGFLSVTEDGLITDGVAHVHPELSAFGSPDILERQQLNHRMYSLAADRATTRNLWKVGEPFLEMV